MKLSSIQAFFATSLLSTCAFAVDKTVNPDLVAKLRSAATNLDRLALLPDDEDWTFDFNNQSNSHYQPGGVVNANAATFPTVIGNGMTMAILNLGPCSMLPPHLHPRASNYVVAVHGTTQTYMIAENGARTVSTLLSPGQMTIFPQGAIHTMFNTGCDNAQLVSALSSEDTGTMNLVNGLYQFGDEDADLVNAAFGYQNVVGKVSEGKVPAVGSGSVFGKKQCLEKCKGVKAGDTWGMRAQ
ncbi:cupin-like protein 1 [Elsinoe australis]|uniref:Cupin-like protein 1 n=1 Tax=Elsinoe australis TaxID=40998 RepID=A0A4V6DUD9_9PEZI|nr:cupin-like protein 1 [Elsinoe australis]